MQSVVCDKHGEQRVTFMCNHIVDWMWEYLSYVDAFCLREVRGLDQDENTIMCGLCSDLTEVPGLSFEQFNAQANLFGLCGECLDTAKRLQSEQAKRDK